ncbi:hypothetical protein L914_03675 [Phytophthora nicotianae]|uniref:Uncharacterized protein n=2 Tax=Phytophthora nicotianae TaxID=4792 RepID=V9FQW0_PHYNI|nr:hypothetical protein F443_03821 [Phytophthora nicotianae P1569]ETM52751.1 hypothetical protein L914_03675 [Phytophthora nicotianae]
MGSLMNRRLAPRFDARSQSAIHATMKIEHQTRQIDALVVVGPRFNARKRFLAISMGH